MACAPVAVNRSLEVDKRRIATLVHNVLADLRDAESIRELGIMCIPLERYDKAKLFLKRAHRLDSTDVKSRFYYGLALEFNDQEDDARSIYRGYADLSPFSPYYKLMKGRYLWLSREQLRREMQAIVEAEKQVGLDSLSLEAIAVFPLFYQGYTEEFEPLGKGLSEMIITDLSQIDSLNLVERLRLQTLLQEMALGQSGLVDEKTAPRFGKMLRAKHVVGGAYDIIGTQRLRMDVELWAFPERTPSMEASKADKLKELLKMEKQIVTDILAGLGIELSPEQRQKLNRLPTKNFDAFLAYCHGMDREDNGEFARARDLYATAVNIDPMYSQARERLDAAAALALVGVPRENLVSALKGMSTPVHPNLSGSNLVYSRLRMSSNNIGSFFVPGVNNREAPEEAILSGADAGFGELPDPPDVPGGR
jgi:TolB-like protein